MSQVLAMAERIAQLERMVEHGQEPVSQPEHETTSKIHFDASNTLQADRPSLQSPVETINSGSQKDTPHYPSTSALVDPVTGDQDQSMEASNNVDLSMPSMSEQQLQYWEQNCARACAAYLQLPVEKTEHLLRTHWTWIHPMLMFSARIPFIRDAATGGRFFSELLLCVICLHSTRFTDHAFSDELLARVRLLLGQQIHKPLTIPTIQALLQLSARDMGKGSFSRAWTYSGIGFRMAVDAGIFTRTKGPSTDPGLDRVRQQLAWSCYSWDKIISLYMGRQPTIVDVPEFEPIIADDVAEDHLWVPYGADTDVRDWRPVPSHAYSAFANVCKLAVIINDILFTVYAKKPQQTVNFVPQTRQRLLQWHDQSPSYLKVESSAVQCPPPHILTQNLLYHATLILLHRPFRSDSRCRTVSQDAAKEIERLFLLLESSFGLSHTTYLMSYCAYTAATVALQDLHDGLEGSQTRIDTYLRALEGTRPSCPGIQTSIDIIHRHLEKRGHSAATQPAIPMLPQDVDYLPAFPIDASADLMNFGTEDLSGLPFGGLDSFSYFTAPSDGFGNFF